MYSIVTLLALVVPGQVSALPITGDVAARVRQLTAELDAPEKARRDAAERALLGMGSTVLELLPSITDATPPEMARRLQSVRAELERAAVRESFRAAPVTIRAQDTPLGDILREIGRQTGNPLLGPQAGSAGTDLEQLRVSVDFDSTPFWSALDQALDQAGVDLEGNGPGETPRLSPRRDGDRRRAEGTCYSGPFRLEATQVTASKQFRNPALHVVGLDVRLQWEPRVRVISLRLLPGSFQASDDQGRPVLLTESGSNPEVFVARGDSTSIHFDLRPGERTSRRIAALRAGLVAVVGGPEATFRLQAPDRGHTTDQRIAWATVALRSLGREGPDTVAQFTITYDQPHTAFESHRSWYFDNRAWLETRDGRRIEPSGKPVVTERQSENAVSLAVRFPSRDDQRDFTFCYLAPTAIDELTVECEFKNLELP